jgi:hypothetical protein
MAIPESVQKKIDKKLKEAKSTTEEEVKAARLDVPSVTDKEKIGESLGLSENLSVVPENNTFVAKAVDQPIAVPKVKEYIEPPKPPSDAKKECVKEIGKILAQYGVESNIPVTHEYWKLVGKYRSL